MNVGELRARLDAPGDKPQLLDVREPAEFEICRIDGSVLIPLGELARRAHELPQDCEIVVICHHGNRSDMAASYLQQAHGLEAINLQGGVAAWAREIDPSMKQY